MEKDLFFKGVRPAVNVGNSVSRVGSKAQPYALKIASGNLRYQLAQFREYQVFAQFENDLDAITKAILERGNLFVEVLKQKPNQPLELYKEVIIVLAATFNFIKPLITNYKNLSNIVANYEENLFKFLNSGNLHKVFFPIFENMASADKKSNVPDVLFFPLTYFNNKQLAKSL